MIDKVYTLGKLEITSNVIKEEIEKHELTDLFWETTLTCNMNCDHCGSSATSKIYKEELTTEEIKKALKSIAEDYDAHKVFLNVTGGEPLLRKDLFDVLEYAISLGFKWGMTSNGTLLNDKNIKKLKDTKITALSISIDGLEKTHDSFRNLKGSYQRIIKNIKKLKKEKFIKTMGVTTVVTKKNISELDELLQVMKDLEIDIWRILPIDPIGRAQKNKDLLLDDTDKKKVLEFIKKHRKEEKKMIITYACTSYLGLDYEFKVRKNAFFCRAGINIGSILYNGDIYVCPNVPRIKKHIQGNVKENRFMDVWNNKYKEFRENTIKQNKVCKACKHNKYCKGGSLHTWNFNENKQNSCLIDIL